MAAGWMPQPVQSASRLLLHTGPDPQQPAHSQPPPVHVSPLVGDRSAGCESAVSSAVRRIAALLPQMKRICDVTGKKANNANTVTFSNTKNARLQHVNLQKKNFFSPELNRNVRLKVATSTMRTITKLGLDETAKKYGCDLSKF